MRRLERCALLCSLFTSANDGGWIVLFSLTGSDLRLLRCSFTPCRTRAERRRAFRHAKRPIDNGRGDDLTRQAKLGYQTRRRANAELREFLCWRQFITLSHRPVLRCPELLPTHQPANNHRSEWTG
jgi:hypothetical protein